MALNSPGVEISVVNESFYTPAAAGTTPLIFVATAEDKINPSGTVAAGTQSANAGKVYLITSQRDLTDTFGTPLFYTDSSGNPLHGNELNEYGLQAAYSALGVSSRAYIVRADIDLTKLLPSSSIPVGDPVAGTYWVDTATSIFGIKEWNATSQQFTVKTVTVLDDNASPSVLSSGVISGAYGSIGDYVLVLTSANTETQLWYKDSGNNWVKVKDTFDTSKRLAIAPHTSVPPFDASTATGSIWITTTTPNNGADWIVKYYNDSTRNWETIDAPLYPNRETATNTLDPAGGGLNILAGNLYVDHGIDESAGLNADFQILRRSSTGQTNLVGNLVSTYATSGTTYTLSIAESTTGSNVLSSAYNMVMTATNTTTFLGQLLATAVSSQPSLVNTQVIFDAENRKTTLRHKLGGELRLSNATTATLSLLGFVPYDIDTQQGNGNLFQDITTGTTYRVSNWKPLIYEATATAPFTDPADDTLWFDNRLDQVDIMVNSGTYWVGYRVIYPSTDPLGPIIQATEPVDGDRSDGGNLVTGDIWIDTSDLEQYGVRIYVRNNSLTTSNKWVLQDTTDQSTGNGWVFADARWGTSGSATEPASIENLLLSNYVDPDAPNPLVYPSGLKLWNTRRSGYNVKRYVKGHINIYANNGQNIRLQTPESLSAYETDKWVSQFPTAENGAGIFGRKAQRQVIVKELQSLVNSNLSIRDTDSVNFNLITAPGYPELIGNMVTLNNDRGITAFVIGDTPMRLAPTGNAISTYMNNSNGAPADGEDGLTTVNEYLAVYYPSGFTTDNSGNNIVVPPSHMMLRTFINNDNKSYQWFPPAGTRRGNIDNVSNIGYIDSEGEFRSQTIPQSLRDTMYSLSLNPITNLTGVGLLAYGQKTKTTVTSALDRVNVARLIAYLRRQLDLLSRPFLFEPNDSQTRREIKAAAESLMLELVGQRALYDFIVVCDETNNTPARIDRNELYVDIAVEPVKAVEFIYIPLRLKNRGDIEAGL